MNKAFDVVVVGAGPVGLSAALAFAHAKYSVAIVGATTSPYVPNDLQPWDARVFALSRRSQQLLADARVWSALPTDRVQVVNGMEIWGDQVDEPGFLAFQAGESGVSELTWIVEQQFITNALHTALQFYPNVQLCNGEVLDLKARDGRWQIQTQLDASNGLPSTPVFEAPLVVAADGGASSTRQHVGLDFPIQSYAATGCVSTFKAKKPHLGIARQWFVEGSVLALLPLPGAYVSMVWSVPDTMAEDLKRLTLEQLAIRVTSAHPLVAHLYGELAPAGGLYSYPLRHGVASEWVKFDHGACLALMGDAAHLVHPLAGQGLNLGLEDVAALREIVLNASESGVSHGLVGHADASGVVKPLLWRKWQRHRKVEVRPVHALMNGLFHLFRLNVVGSQWARNRGMQCLDRMPLVKRWLVAQAMR